MSNVVNGLEVLQEALSGLGSSTSMAHVVQKIDLSIGCECF